MKAGETVLDLGSGSGIDVLLSARRVGPTGKAYGLDMTDEMLALARENQKKSGVAIKIADNLDLIRMAKERDFEDLSQMQSLDFGSMVNIEPIQVDDVEPLRAEIESFLDSVRTGPAATGKTGSAASQAGSAGVSAEDGYAAVEMAERITNIIKDQAWTTAPA